LNEHELIAYAERVLKARGGVVPEKLDLYSFGSFAEDAMYAAKGMQPGARARHYPDMFEWLEGFQKLYYRFDKEVALDPMILYRPQHDVSEEFHKSNAFVRYYMAGNGTSKTQSGVAESYFTLTNQHPWKTFEEPQNDVGMIGLVFSTYKGAVFEPKFLTGETGNILSPMFPDNGKWLHRYNKKMNTIVIACKECANKGGARDCTHYARQSSLRLFSDDQGWEVIQGANYRLMHFDEHLAEGFFNEAKQRIIRVKGGSMIVTGTPLFGLEAWEIRLLLNRFNGDPAENLRVPSNPNSEKYVEVFQIDQFEAGIVPHDAIRAEMAGMDKFEIAARVYGKPGPLAKKPVFDREAVQDMHDKATNPDRYVIVPEVPLEHYPTAAQLVCKNVGVDDRSRGHKDPWTGLCVWEEPQPGTMYVMGIDTAKGIYAGDGKGRSGDASCCSVFKLSFDDRNLLCLDMVAQYHGWIAMLEYGDEVYKLGTWYNGALAVVETTGGYGEAVLMRLKSQLYYPNIYQGTGKESQNIHKMESRVGIDTNVGTKPFMVSLAQSLIKNRQVKIPCSRTLEEMVAFEQVDTGPGGARLRVPRFEGTGGAHDDRVMAYVIVASVAQDQNHFNPVTFEMMRQRDPANRPQVSDFWKDIRAETDPNNAEYL